MSSKLLVTEVPVAQLAVSSWQRLVILKVRENVLSSAN